MHRGHCAYEVELAAELVSHDIADDEVNAAELHTSGLHDVLVQVNSSDVEPFPGEICGKKSVACSDIECGNRIIGYRI
jgi:hypothetical protein